MDNEIDWGDVSVGIVIFAVFCTLLGFFSSSSWLPSAREYRAESEISRENFLRVLQSAILREATIQPRVLEIPGELPVPQQQPVHTLAFDTVGALGEVEKYYRCGRFIRFNEPTEDREWVTISPTLGIGQEILMELWARDRSDHQSPGWDYRFVLQRIPNSEPAGFRLNLVEAKEKDKIRSSDYGGGIY